MQAWLDLKQMRKKNNFEAYLLGYSYQSWATGGTKAVITSTFGGTVKSLKDFRVEISSLSVKFSIRV